MDLNKLKEGPTIVQFRTKPSCPWHFETTFLTGFERILLFIDFSAFLKIHQWNKFWQVLNIDQVSFEF